MSSSQADSQSAPEVTSGRNVEMKLEVVLVPVSDVDRAKRFYEMLGWRLDADFATGEDFRVVQFTPRAPKRRSSSARASPRRCRARSRACS
jgi:hypothetical protein